MAVFCKEPKVKVLPKTQDEEPCSAKQGIMKLNWSLYCMHDLITLVWVKAEKKNHLKLFHKHCLFSRIKSLESRFVCVNHP